MYLVISKDKRIPQDIKNFDYEMWSIEEFVEKASSDDGIDLDVDGGMYFNLDSLTEQLYESLNVYSDRDDFEIVYYKFSDQDIEPSFYISEGIVNYEVEQPKEEKEKEPEPKQEEELPKEQVNPDYEEESNKDSYSLPVDVVDTQPMIRPGGLDVNRLESIIDETDFDDRPQNAQPAKVILFGSSKGGTGKTFTCLITAYRFAQTHPNLKIALADFDIIDGQIGININRVTPTVADFYKQYKAGFDTFTYLSNCSLHNEHFNSNLDFYLAPPMDIPELTDDDDFWQKVFELLILNYDVVFFDSGIDYMGKRPISRLYKIADKIIITSNPSINSVKSVIKQMKTLSGQRKNPVFKPEDKILDRVFVVLTRVYKEKEINNIVVANISKYADVIAAFGNIDSIISRVQWFQQWELIGRNEKICEYLDIIASLDGID